MNIQRRHWAVRFVIAAIVLAMPLSARAEENGPTPPTVPDKPPALTLVKALLCEGMKEFDPQNETILFSATLGQAACFTAFDPVPEKTEIHHNWFQRDRPDARFKLTLKPPRWATFSRISLGSSDVGPWRVEVTDANGNLLKTLRFSVTE